MKPAIGADLHTLTGAYALHATSDTERVAFRRHLTACAPCRAEVREYRDTAARLGGTTTAAPPPHLRQAVLTRIHTERQARTPRRRVPVVRPAAAAAVLLFAMAVVLGVLTMTRQHDLDQALHRTDALSTVMRARDARFAHGDGLTVVVSASRNQGVLLADLPPPPAGHTYQAWTVDSRYHPAGPLTGGMTELTGVTTADRVAVTVEPPGGSAQPTTEPVAQIALQ
jgi:anti-sigma-K factor RskA